MEVFFATIDYWHWLVLGLALVIIELFASSTFFLWMGVSAIMVGILYKLFPSLSWQIQLLLFSGLSIFSIFLAKKYFPVKTIDNELNTRAKRHIGNIYTVVSKWVTLYGSRKAAICILVKGLKLLIQIQSRSL